MQKTPKGGPCPAVTEPLYEANAYLQTFTAVVTGCAPAPGGWAVTLDRTAFYPEGGGQPCDTGTLGGARVLAVHAAGGDIVHLCDAPLEAGRTVAGAIDWAARLDAMQQHTGEHILSGALHRLFGAENVGFHIGSPWVRMDTSIPLTPEQLAEAEAAANDAVRADTPVRCYVPDAAALAATEYRSKKTLEGPVRLVEAGGDRCACCGTHLARTGEVGLVKIVSYQHYKGGMRLAVACGRRAYDAVPPGPTPRPPGGCFRPRWAAWPKPPATCVLARGAPNSGWPRCKTPWPTPGPRPRRRGSFAPCRPTAPTATGCGASPWRWRRRPARRAARWRRAGRAWPTRWPPDRAAMCAPPAAR